MKKILIIALLGILSGCVVAPYRAGVYQPMPVYVEPAPVVVVPFFFGFHHGRHR